MAASELEFFLFTDTYAELHAQGYRALSPVSPYNEDYHIFQTTKEEDVMRAIRTGLNAAGIPVENSKGEASAGQEEINVRYGEVLDASRRARGGEERGEGDRLVEGQVGHLHGEVRHEAGRVVEPPAPVAPRARTGSRRSSTRARPTACRS